MCLVVLIIITIIIIIIIIIITRIDLVHDTCHLCTRSRIDGIKAMLRGISWGKQVIKFANTSNRGGDCLFY